MINTLEEACEIRWQSSSTINKSKSVNVTGNNAKLIDINNATHLVDSSSETNDTVPWNKFLDMLIGVSLERLDNMKFNFENYYGLDKSDIASIDNVFNSTDYEYEFLLHHHLKIIMKEKKFNGSEEFMLDFMNLSNEIIEKIVEYNLLKVGGSLDKPTKWYNQTTRDKLLRQQTKCSSALVELIMCTIVSVCRERENYSDYIIEWLRFLLNEKNNKLVELFNTLPIILIKNEEHIKTSPQLHKNLKLFVKSDPIAQRDILDLIDEIITNPDYHKSIPYELKKSAILINKLFKEIDAAYVLTEDDIEELESITRMLATWSRSGPVSIKNILDNIVDNMVTNQEMWKKDNINKLSNVWVEIIRL
ncbi:unnamed protein product [Diatraea saccharalis]|uniref:Uncharacterized protein n=1 Tax=Diatraea saccharalis TaxID=40085 RepID=A0A9N9QSW8_9NEOP|nr:unnamed protein product [Diatraea saccharalis]